MFKFKLNPSLNKGERAIDLEDQSLVLSSNEWRAGPWPHPILRELVDFDIILIKEFAPIRDEEEAEPQIVKQPPKKVVKKQRNA